MKIPEAACLNCRFWGHMEKRDGLCKRKKGNPPVDASCICLHHKRVSKKVEAQRHQEVKEDD